MASSPSTSILDFQTGEDRAERFHLHPQPGSAGLMLQGNPVGTLTTDPITTEPFNELLPSWNATLVPGGTLTLHVRVQVSDDRWTKWYSFGTWQTEPGRNSEDGQDDEDARVLTDTLRLETLATTYQARVTLQGEGSQLHLLTFATSERAHLTGTPRPGQPEHWGVELAVPEYSQMEHEGGSGWCSPTSLAMVLGALGTQVSVPETAAAVYDEEYPGAGNWVFNVAHAGQLGYHAHLTRLPDLQAAEALIAQGVPLILSIRWGEGELPGAPIPSCNGHLVVLRGFDGEGQPIVNDPAAATAAEVRRTYPRADFERQWLVHSGGLAYVIRHREGQLKEIPASTTDR
ncbi:peptidase C39 family protein [Deinococcus aquiradiocola]|uniref:Peptidase C39 n=1 Tax=Deinococcus aquiradiocola TaxID=393059 RepID=A0A917UV00_9DEIO|nr:peptidase C39 family protein [Deinococcus aquiradiocola]GGJ87118.1 peptidase C39 [Deinococcus aquiradiocola]